MIRTRRSRCKSCFAFSFMGYMCVGNNATMLKERHDLLPMRLFNARI